MLNQSLSNIISAVIGGTLVLVANYLTQRLVHSEKKVEVIRNKIEEAYQLCTRLEIFISVVILRSINTEDRQFYITGVPHKYHINVDEEVECPIDQLEAIIHLYLPNTKSAFLEYQDWIEEVQGLQGFLSSHYHDQKIDLYLKGILRRKKVVFDETMPTGKIVKITVEEVSACTEKLKQSLIKSIKY